MTRMLVELKTEPDQTLHRMSLVQSIAVYAKCSTFPEIATNLQRET